MRIKNLVSINQVNIFYLYAAFSFIFIGAVVTIALSIHLPSIEGIIVSIVGEEKGDIIYYLFHEFVVKFAINMAAPLLLSNIFLIVMCKRYRKLQYEVECDLHKV